MSMNILRTAELEHARQKNETTFFIAAVSGDGSVLMGKKDEILTVHTHGRFYPLVGNIAFASSGPYGLSADGRVLAWFEDGNLRMLRRTSEEQFDPDKADIYGPMEHRDHVRFLLPSNDATMIAAILRSECRVYAVKDVLHAIASLPFAINDPIMRTVQFSSDGTWIHLIENSKVNRVKLKK